MNKPKILIYDIETSPCLGWFWRTGKTQIGSHQVLRPNKIICISYRFSHWKKGVVKNIKWKAKKRSNRLSYNYSDRDLVLRFAKIANKADVIVGHNGDQFDRKIINARLMYYDQQPIMHLITEDTLKQVRQVTNLPSYRLDFLCKYFNLPGKLSTASNLWEDVVFKGKKESLQEMVDYCNQDVLILEMLYNKLYPFVKHKINMAVFNKDPSCCPVCGSNKLNKYGYSYSLSGKKQKYQCLSCSSVSTLGANLIHKPSQYMR